MKNTLLVIAVLFVGACAAAPTLEEKAAIAEKVLREKFVGVYEHKDGANTQRAVFQENGVLEVYVNSKKEEAVAKWEKEEAVANWKICKDGELLVEEKDGHVIIARINKDGSITVIAEIEDGKRKHFTKEDQRTFKRIK